MKRHQIALGILFVALPFFVIAFLSREIEAYPVKNAIPEATSPCREKSECKAYPAEALRKRLNREIVQNLDNMMIGGKNFGECSPQRDF